MFAMGKTKQTEISNGYASGNRCPLILRNPSKHRGKRPVLTALLFAAVLSAFLSACRLIPREQTDPDPGDTYGIVGLPGTRLLFHSLGNGFPEFSRVDPADGAVLGLAGLTSSRKKYAALFCQRALRLYDRGKYVSGYRNDDGLKDVSSFLADYDGDGNDDVFLLLGKEGEPYGERLIVLDFDGKTVKKTYDAPFGNLNPWKVQVCDVDGDGKKEVSLGVYTMAKYHPVYAKRPFLYEFHNRKLYPKWLGSRLSRPFDDYVFCDVDGDKMDELVSVETTQDGKKELNAYQWTGFGFESIGTSRAYNVIRDIGAVYGAVTAVCGSQTASEPKTFLYRNGVMKTEG